MHERPRLGVEGLDAGFVRQPGRATVGDKELPRGDERSLAHALEVPVDEPSDVEFLLPYHGVAHDLREAADEPGRRTARERLVQDHRDVAPVRLLVRIAAGVARFFDVGAQCDEDGVAVPLRERNGPEAPAFPVLRPESLQRALVLRREDDERPRCFEARPGPHLLQSRAHLLKLPRDLPAGLLVRVRDDREVRALHLEPRFGRALRACRRQENRRRRGRDAHRPCPHFSVSERTLHGENIVRQ